MPPTVKLRQTMTTSQDNNNYAVVNKIKDKEPTTPVNDPEANKIDNCKDGDKAPVRKSVAMSKVSSRLVFQQCENIVFSK